MNLDHLTYWSLLGQASILVGNSSSGIMETPSLRLPCVDVGARQRGRTRAANIIHAEPIAEDITGAMDRALSPGFAVGLQNMMNPYGDGNASIRIVRQLVDAPDRHMLLHKLSLDLVGGAFTQTGG